MASSIQKALSDGWEKGNRKSMMILSRYTETKRR